MKSAALRTLAIVLLLLVTTAPGPARAAIGADKVPLFTIRARVATVAGEQPALDKPFAFSLGGASVNMTGDAWSDALTFGADDAKKAVGSYPNSYNRRWPVIVKASYKGIVDPTLVQAQVTFDEGGEPVALEGELFGPTLGLCLWRDDDGTPHVATMAEYNRKFYWSHLQKVSIPEAHRPKKFPIIDRFIGGDNDIRANEQGVKELYKAGFSAMMLPPDARFRKWLLEAGGHRTAWAIYNPPGYAFDLSGDITPESIQKWADDLAAPFIKAGYEPTDMAAYAMSDEPGWYYPGQYAALEKSEEGLARFREYLQAQGLTPQELGGVKWEQVMPVGRASAKYPKYRKLFYWTQRFMAHDSAQHFANCTKAMENAFYPGLPVFTNWNFFSGRYYVPGPVANNGAKQSPDAAMGGHDWFEFGRLRGGTMLWVEDWFGDEQAYQWSFYCAKLRSAARLGGVEFGGYVIPRTAGSREDGIVQKILTVAGHGGKAIKYFVFGPEYNFPGNCYSFKSNLLPKMAEAHAMIGAAEEVLWPGRPVPAEVAILMPRSSMVWDAEDIEVPHQIYDATNTAVWARTVDYMGEVWGLYVALQHANVPTDFLDEDDLGNAEAMARYKAAFYVTEPNIPVEYHATIKAWVEAGGVLVTVPGAGSKDRYDEPASLLATVAGIREVPRQRMLVGNIVNLPVVGKVANDTIGEFEVAGDVSELIDVGDDVNELEFEDGKPAGISRIVGKGQLVHFTFFPGMSYFRSGNFTGGKLHDGFNEALMMTIVLPAAGAGVTPQVKTNVPGVETPMLVSDAGVAVTLLNWTNRDIDALDVTVRTTMNVRSAASVKHGELKFEQTDGEVRVTLPLGAVDVLMLRP